LRELETQVSVSHVQQQSLFSCASTTPDLPSVDVSLLEAYVEKISSIDLNSLTPLEAFQKLVDLQHQANDF
jgi:hypothetical protein